MVAQSQCYGSRRVFQNAYELLKFPRRIKIVSFNVCARYFVWNFKGTLLTHWGGVTHICVGNLTIIGWENGLSSGRCQAIIWTNAGILLIGLSGTNFSEIFAEIITFSLKKMYLKVSSGKWHPFCLGLNVLTLQMLETGYSGFSDQYQACWFTGSLTS